MSFPSTLPISILFKQIESIYPSYFLPAAIKNAKSTFLFLIFIYFSTDILLPTNTIFLLLLFSIIGIILSREENLETTNIQS